MNEKKHDGFLSVAVVIAALILFARTSEVMSYFAPMSLNILIGFDVSSVYGGVTAALVEIAALALHFNRRAALSGTAQFVKWTLLSISGACQVLDGFLITDTLTHQSDTIKVVFQYGVPLVPLLVVVLIFSIGHLPETNEPKREFRFVGLRHIPDKLSWIWNGTGVRITKPQAMANVNQSVVHLPKLDGKTKANPLNPPHQD